MNQTRENFLSDKNDGRDINDVNEGEMMMRKRLLACIVAAAMLFESVPVSAAEISRERDTAAGEVHSEVSMEETSTEEMSVKETSTESGSTDTTAPEESKTEESSKEDKTQSAEEGQETQPATGADSAESVTETETTTETETETETTETETETEKTEIESALEELSLEEEYEEYPNAIIPFEIGGTDIFAGLNISLYSSGIENQAKYDPREEAPDELTAVKDQNPWGTCWSFAVIAVLENAMVRQGLANNRIDLSEAHLAYFCGHTGSDKLGNANDDTIVSDPESSWKEGGNTYRAATRLMNWHGAASEKEYPYSTNMNSTALSESDAQNIEAMAHDIYFIPAGKSESDKVTAIKKLIAQYGCVEWSYGDLAQYYNSETYAYYNPTSGTNHAITIVGWDDDFSVENFGSSSEPAAKPDKNGAWIVKNSWGDSWGEKGYFYISYEDASLGNGNAASVMVAADKGDYDNNYFYGNTVSTEVGGATKAAQVYEVKSGANTEKLAAVSIMLYSEKVKYSIQVYKNPELVDGVVKDPESGEPMLENPVTGETGYAGLYTIDLPESVIFSKGDLMSIVFTFSSFSFIYTDKDMTDSSGKISTNTTHPGQSFEGTSSTWKDMHDSGYNYNYRINALTVDNVYRVTFLDALGNQLDVQEVEGGNDATPPKAPDRNGYTFKGWSGSYQKISKDTKLTAKYEPITYSIAYELNGGTIETANLSTYTIETETFLLAEPVREGYFFAGWYEQSDFTGASIASINKGSMGDKKLYAKWQEDTSALVKPVLIPQGGIIEEGQSVVIRASKGVEIYYTLDGTVPTAESGIKYSGPIKVSKNVTIKAVAVQSDTLSEIAEASYTYIKINLVLAEKETDLLRCRSKRLELSQIPTTKSESDVTWTTSNKRIVTVSEDGTITGIKTGTATVTAKTKNRNGDEVTASCQVTVKEVADDIGYGSYEDIVWYIDSNGKLVVMGTGEFSRSRLPNRAPWYAYREEIQSAEIKVTDIADVSHMFSDCHNLTELDVSNFKTDKVTTMNHMFYRCSSLTELDVSGFETDKVTDMSSMFCECSSLTELDASGFKTDKVTDMSHMFNGCSSLTELNVRGFKTDRVGNMSSMFIACNGLTDLDLSSFDLSSLTTADYMLPTSYYSKLRTIHTPRNLGQTVSLITNLGNYHAWFQPDGTVITELPKNKSDSILITQLMGGTYQNIVWRIDENGKLTVEGEGECSNSTESNGTPWNACFPYIKSAEVNVTGMTNASYLLYNCVLLKDAKLNGFDTSKITDFRFMFYSCSNLTSLDLSGFHILADAKVDNMLLACSNLSTIKTPCNLSVSIELPAGTNDKWYLPDGTTVTELPKNLSTSTVVAKNRIPNQPITKTISGSYKTIKWQIDTDGKLTVEGTGEISGTSSPNRAPWYDYGEYIKSAEINVTGMTDASYLFYNCSKLKEVDLSGFNTSTITKMDSMFEDCSSLTDIDLKGFQTSKVSSMTYMFEGCSSLTSLDLSSFDIQETTTVSSMLNDCSSLTTINTPCYLQSDIQIPKGNSDKWYLPDGATTTKLPLNLSYSIVVRKNKVPDMAITEMISGSYGDITWQLDTTGKLTVEGTGEIAETNSRKRAPWYYYREKIQSAEVNVTGMTNASYLFCGCSALESLDLSGFDASALTNANAILQDCTKLATIHTPLNLTSYIVLPVSGNEAWYQDDETEVTRLPRNLEQSILITKKTKSGTIDPVDKFYKVTFDIQGHGTEIKAVEIKEGGKISEPTPPSAEGYRFTGWYKEADCKTLWDFEKDTVKADTTLYAGWEEIKSEPGPGEKVYRVTFELQGHGTEVAAVEINAGDKISEPTPPSAEGYRFTGWYKEADCKTLWDFENDTVEADTTLYAGWEEIKSEPGPGEKVYKVTFELQGHGTEIATVEVIAGGKISEPASPSAEGYQFTGWYKEADCITLWDFAVDTVEGDMTLYAGWKEKTDEPPVDNIPDGIWIAPIKDYTYTGKAIIPAVDVYYNKKKLTAGRDYTITYQNNTKAALSSAKKAPQVSVKGKGNYSGTKKLAFTINKAQLTEAENLKAAAKYPKKVKYTPVVTLSGNILKAGTDYTLTYLDESGNKLKKQPTNVGNYQMRIVGKGSCEGEINFSYVIAESGGANAINKGKATVGGMTYGGATPEVALTVGDKTLNRNTDYMVSFTNTNKKGTATATFIGIGDYTGTLKKSFKVQAAPIQEKDVQIDKTAAYEKGGVKPEPIVTVNGAELVAGTDYTVTYKNNTKVGDAKATIKGKGNYTGSLTKEFKVESKSLEAVGVRIYVSDVLSGKKPSVMVYDSNGKKLSANNDYRVSIDKAAHHVTITGGKNGLYKVQEPIVVRYQELAKGRQVTSVALNKKATGFPKYFEYTGKEVELQKDWLKVKAGKTVLKSDEFEILGYVNNIKKGTASVIIRGTEGYGGIKVLNFKIKAKGLL